MRVYNFPNDEIHIKNNKGEELAKIGPDGVEIEGTSFPVVGVEDAGKTLVVNDEGKIVAGEAGGGGYPEIKIAHFTMDGANLVCDVPYATFASDMMNGVSYFATFPIPDVGILYGVGLDASGNYIEFASGQAVLTVGTNYIEYIQATVLVGNDDTCTYEIKNIKISATVTNPS